MQNKEKRTCIPVAIIAGDVHFTVPSLDVASEVVRSAQAKAVELGVPLILNGDTLDTKSIIRAEVANRVIELLKNSPCRTYLNRGNHDQSPNFGPLLHSHRDADIRGRN